MSERNRNPSVRPIRRLAGVLCGCAILSLHPADAPAQSRLTRNTLTLDEGATPGGATMASAVWLAGHWRGPALGGQAEELWLPAAGGAMLGMFRVATAEAPQFYELFALRPSDGSLVIQLKHFNADMTGWEAKAETVDFHLVRAEPDALYFDGLTYRRVSEDELSSFVAVRNPDGTVSELVFEFRRVR